MRSGGSTIFDVSGSRWGIGDESHGGGAKNARPLAERASDYSRSGTERADCRALWVALWWRDRPAPRFMAGLSRGPSSPTGSSRACVRTSTTRRSRSCGELPARCSWRRRCSTGHEKTGGPTCGARARRQSGPRAEDDGLWTNRIYGRTIKGGLGPPHGLVGNVLALLPALDESRREQLERETAAVLSKAARSENGL